MSHAKKAIQNVESRLAAMKLLDDSLAAAAGYEEGVFGLGSPLNVRTQENTGTSTEAALMRVIGCFQAAVDSLRSIRLNCESLRVTDERLSVCAPTGSLPPEPEATSMFAWSYAHDMGNE